MIMKIYTVTIIGANGTMGRNIAAIFASFGNAKVYLVSRTIEKSIEAKEKAFLSVKADCVKEKMIPCDYSQLETCVKDSDLIFEACAENWEIKKDVHTRISKALSYMEFDKVICSGTSGLSITGLAEMYDEEYRTRFVGMHFFNPPYNMILCELIPTKYTNRDLFDELYEYTENVLRRTTVETKDMPAFLGNRIGFQFINEALQLAEQYKYNGGIDYIDAILGAFTGRAMAPLVTANFVGLDVHKAIVDNLHQNTNDYAHETFVLPHFVEKLIETGNLGRKSGAGLYKTVVNKDGTKMHQVYDIEQNEYREVIKYTFPFVERMVGLLKTGDYDDAFKSLIENQSQEANICCMFLLKYILYALHTADCVGEDIHSADDVMATGFNWCPPLALIEAFSGTESFGKLCEERIDSEILNKIKLEELLDKVEKSQYDYRRFVKAKR